MTKKELIEKLKKNEKPFGLLSEEEQEVLRNTPTEHRLYFDGYGWVNDPTEGISRNNAVQIKDDYEPCPKFIECEVFCKEDGDLMFWYQCDNWVLDMAPKFANFIGFMYDCTPCIVDSQPMAYRIGDGRYLYSVSGLDRIKSGEATVVRPSKVLFRKD